MIAAQRFIVTGEIPGHDADPGQVISAPPLKDKHLALKLIKPWVRGSLTYVCECGAVFASLEAHEAHEAKRHPAPPPPPKAKTKPAPTTPPVATATPQEETP